MTRATMTDNTKDATIKASWMASISLCAGILSLIGVACFYFPEILTSRDFRAIYSESFARVSLAAGVALCLICGCIGAIRGPNTRTALVGLVCGASAIALGGSGIALDGPITGAEHSFAFDWFAVNLFFSALIFIPIEKMFPVSAMSPLRGGWKTDLGYYFVGHVFIQFSLVVIVLVTGTLDALFDPLVNEAIIGSWPVFIQLPLAILVADVFQALLHRIYHKVPALWRIHSIHHSSQHIDWLAGSRMHIAEILLTRIIVLAPLLILGFSEAVINMYIVLAGLQAVLAHVNVRVKVPYAIEKILVGPRYHHWHHAKNEAYDDANYAIHLPVIDRIMGTFKIPENGDWPDSYGISGGSVVPNGFWAQMVHPFRRNASK